ncbi:MAG: hypothetical protein WCG66_00650 [bacterium]
MKCEHLFLAACLLLTGCAAVEHFDKESPPEFLTAHRTEFFRSGPAQAFPPEKLDKDTTLKILAKDSGYAFVQLPDHRTGYVVFSDLRAAPPVAPSVPFDPVIAEEVVEVPLPDFGVMPDEIPEKLRKK